MVEDYARTHTHGRKYVLGMHIKIEYKHACTLVYTRVYMRNTHTHTHAQAIATQTSTYLVRIEKEMHSAIIQTQRESLEERNIVGHQLLVMEIESMYNELVDVVVGEQRVDCRFIVQILPKPTKTR